MAGNFVLAILTTHPIQYQVPLWQALARNGGIPFEVWYLTDHGVRQSRDREFGKTFSWDLDTLSGYSYQFLDVAPGATPASFWRCRLRESLRERLRNRRVNVLWIQGWQVAAYWQAVREAKAAGVELWLRGESNDLSPVACWKRPLKRLQLGWLFKRVDRFLYIGSANKRLYQKYGVPESHLYPTPYAVDNERFARQAASLRQQRGLLRRQWGIPEDAYCILFCGKFIPKKRPMDLVAAAHRLRQTGRIPHLHLLFVGSGMLGGELRKVSRVVFDADSPIALATKGNADVQAGQRPPATFAGFLNQTDISKAYVAADCLALPSDSGETWGLVVNEALASGLQCVVSDACGCAEDLSRATKKVISFRCGDIVHFADQLTRNAERFDPTSSNENYDSKFSIENTVTTVQSFLGVHRTQ